MMNWIIAKCKRLGLIPAYPADDQINAEIDNAAADHEKAVNGMREATEKRRRSNALLRTAITRAKNRTSSFEDFEEFVEKQRKKLNGTG